MDYKSTFNLLFFIKRTRMLRTGEAPIYMRITVNGKRCDTGLCKGVDPNLWSSEKGFASGTTKEAKSVNALLDSIRIQIQRIIINLRAENKPVTAVSIRNAYMGIEDNAGKKVLALYREHNKKIKQLENIDYSPETIERYEVSLKHTENFIKSKYQKDDLFLTELNNEFIQDYEIYFKTVRKCAHNTTLKYIKNFKKIINIAISNGDLKQNPFPAFKMKLKKVDRGFLNDEELDIIINKELHVQRLSQVRDCFVFSCFTGLAHSDLYNLSKENIVTGTDGGKWIKIKRKKTDNLCSIPILSVSQKILDKYKNDPFCLLNNKLLPVITNQKTNSYLKEIATICGIEKNFSSHLARHTFATTVTLNNNVPIESVSKMLGHSSINMTKIYARLLDKKVGKDMEHLNGRYSISI
ncbi:MAG: hypothetical protein A2W91_04300 [Bacteroidetes bacterium GWF2_38_335]|nr:MAG: hypothetical protein A2W91_04300 [Bacteroidetes bacterium GWF2_38_335]